MDLLSNLEHQLSQIVDCLDYVGLVGLAYLAVRWRRYLKSQGRALLTVLAVPALYVLVVTAISALTKVAGAERYYRPVVPLLLVGAGAGFWCASRDFCRKGVGRAIGMAAIGISLLWILKVPLRSHRSPQTRAGKWLAKNDLSYTGPVFSDYSQPVYYTGMRYVPTGPVGRRLYRRLKSRGLEVKYFILEREGDNGVGWAHRLVQEEGWRRVYYDARRGLSIYLNPLLDGPGTAPDAQSEPARFSEALPGLGRVWSKNAYPKQYRSENVEKVELEGTGQGRGAPDGHRRAGILPGVRFIVPLRGLRRRPHRKVTVPETG